MGTNTAQSDTNELMDWVFGPEVENTENEDSVKFILYFSSTLRLVVAINLRQYVNNVNFVVWKTFCHTTIRSISCRIYLHILILHTCRFQLVLKFHRQVIDVFMDLNRSFHSHAVLVIASCAIKKSRSTFQTVSFCEKGFWLLIVANSRLFSIMKGGCAATFRSSIHSLTSAAISRKSLHHGANKFT